jgi:hypothetical protein
MVVSTRARWRSPCSTQVDTGSLALALLDHRVSARERGDGPFGQPASAVSPNAFLSLQIETYPWMEMTCE